MILVFRDQKMQIMEYLDEVCLGARGQTAGMDQEHLFIALVGMAANKVTTSSNVEAGIVLCAIRNPSACCLHRKLGT